MTPPDDDLVRMLRRLQSDSGDLPPEVRARIQERLSAAMAHDPDPPRVSPGHSVTTRGEGSDLRRSSDHGEDRRGTWDGSDDLVDFVDPSGPTPGTDHGRRPFRVALAAAVAVLAVVVGVGLGRGSERSPAPPEPHAVDLEQILQSVRSAPSTDLATAGSFELAMTQVGPSGFPPRIRERVIRPDGSFDEIVRDLDGTVQARYPNQPPGSFLFATLTYEQFRSIRPDAQSLAAQLDDDAFVAGAAEVAALIVTPPELRAAAIEVLDGEGFRWAIDDRGLIVGSRGAGPIEQIAVDPAAGRVIAHGWVDQDDDDLLTSAHVTIWKSR